MTYKDLIDALVRDSGDDASAYRTNAYRWLNFVRQEASVRGNWPSTKNSEATFTTDAAVTNGIYAITGFDQIIGTDMYDVTNDCVIRRDVENTLKAYDANSNQFGPPTLWSDSGMTAAGERQVRFWPIPEAAYEIRFLGSRALVDVTSANENVDIDAYFGPISSIGGMLFAGLRYFHDLNDNQDVAQVGRARATFYDAIKQYSASDGSDSVKMSRLEPVGRRPYARPTARLDPSHFNNR